jgi:hypothetical protein
MKTITIKSLLILLAFTISFVSCKDKETTPKNHIKYDGKIFEINYGILEYWGNWDGELDSYNFDLDLSSHDWTNNNEIVLSENFMFFQMYSSSETDLLPGTYNYNYDSYNALTFDYGEFGLNFNVDNAIYSEIEGGSVKIKKSGAIYEITINCVDFDGKKVSAFYKGKLTFFDSSNIPIKGKKNKNSRRMQNK